MSDNVQIALIICGTIIFVQILGLLIIKSLWNKSNNTKVKKDTERFGYCKGSTYPAPKIVGIGHNPSPKGNKPGFPGGNGYQPKLRYHDNSELEKMRKPPKTGSGIK